jgi:hypothetical protein
MTIDELIQTASARGWQTRLRVPGRTGQDAGDNLYVVDHDADGWLIGYLERGATEVLERCADEDEAATAAYRYLARAHEAQPRTGSAGTTAAAEAPADAPTDASGEGWTTWTFGKRD